MNKVLMHPVAKPLVFVLCLLPFAWLVYGAFTDGLGANPAEYLIRSAGDWTLRFICIVLAVTPLVVPALISYRAGSGSLARADALLAGHLLGVDVSPRVLSGGTAVRMGVTWLSWNRM